MKNSSCPCRREETGVRGQGSGIGKAQKWSSVELHCQPATGSSIIMVIFRWPSALHRQLERAEAEIEQKERHDKTAEGKRAETRNATLKDFSCQSGKRLLKQRNCQKIASTKQIHV